jgi:hypothetical protein
MLLYPNVVALTAIIASPHWLRLARTAAGIEQILDRIAIDVTGLRHRSYIDPFIDWLIFQQREGKYASEVLTVLPTKVTDAQRSDPFWQRFKLVSDEHIDGSSPNTITAMSGYVTES